MQIHQHTLRPQLGHPNQRTELEALCCQETARQNQMETTLEKNWQAQKAVVCQMGVKFVAKITQTSEQLLMQFDNLLTVDEVERASEVFLQ